ncbi:MAG: DUF1836 domain-containing protein [Eubacteriales bacterium]|nr:DUF1836 domain-containing protein [Eubacteriales bacterium]
MQWTIPGTTLTGHREQADEIGRQFEGLYLAGDLALGQVASLAGLENHIIQNWVKRGFLAGPKNKRYTMEQLCRILNINVLRGTLPLEQVQVLMSYLNGSLTDESDDLVDDTVLYFYFVRLAARCPELADEETWQDALKEVTADYAEPVPGARKKLENVLRIMMTAWMAGCLKARAEEMLGQIQ